MRRAHLIAALALLALAALAPPAGAMRWTPVGTLVESPYELAVPQVDFDARDGAVAAGVVNGSPYVAQRRPGRGFGKLRTFPGPPNTSFAPVLDPGGGGGLVGAHFEDPPGGPRWPGDECCLRVAAAPLARDGTAGPTTELSPADRDASVPRIFGDGRGSASAVWRQGAEWISSTRRRGGGAFPAPTPLQTPAGFGEGDIALRPSGWAFAAWTTADRLQVLVSERRPGGEFGPPVTVGALDPESSLRAGAVRIEVGERGQVWVLWSLGAQDNNPWKGRRVAAPRRSAGDYGPAHTVGRATEASYSDAAVDDAGRLHFVWHGVEGRIDVRTVAPNGTSERIRNLMRSGSPGPVAVGAGRGGRAVAVWRGEKELFAVTRSGSRGFGAVRRLDGGAPSRFQVTVSDGGEVVVMWRLWSVEGQRIRYVFLKR